VSLPEAEGELQSVPVRVRSGFYTAAALQRRADLKTGALVPRRCPKKINRSIAADYYPYRDRNIFQASSSRSQEFIAKGSTSRNQDFIGSEIRARAAYTASVDNGKVGGQVLKAALAREIN